MTILCQCDHSFSRHDTAGVCHGSVSTPNGMVPCGCRTPRELPPHAALTSAQSTLDARQAATRIVTEGMEWTRGDAYTVADEYLNLLVDIEVAASRAARATTPESALALERATTPDPVPVLPPLEIEDGFGV